MADTENIDELKQQVHIKEKFIQELKDKTKVYVQKPQQKEQETNKQAQEKVDAAKTFLAKMRDEEAKLRAEITRLSSKETEFTNVCNSMTKELIELTSTIFKVYGNIDDALEFK